MALHGSRWQRVAMKRRDQLVPAGAFDSLVIDAASGAHIGQEAHAEGKRRASLYIDWIQYIHVTICMS